MEPEYVSSLKINGVKYVPESKTTDDSTKRCKTWADVIKVITTEFTSDPKSTGAPAASATVTPTVSTAPTEAAAPETSSVPAPEDKGKAPQCDGQCPECKAGDISEDAEDRTYVAVDTNGSVLLTIDDGEFVLNFNEAVELAEKVTWAARAVLAQEVE